MTPAYIAGYTAFNNGDYRHMNPYHPGSPQYYDWDTGWNDAYDDKDHKDYQDEKEAQGLS